MIRFSAVLRALGNAACVVAIAVGALAAGADLIHLVGFGAVVPTALADLALAFLCALLLGPPVAVAIYLTQLAMRQSRSIRALFILAVGLFACGAAIVFCDALYRPHHSVYIEGSIGFGLAFALLAAMVMLARARLLLLLAALALTAIDLITPRALPREAHDLSRVLAVACALGWLAPLWRRLQSAKSGRLALALSAALVFSLVSVRHLDGWFTGWRSLAWQHAYWQPRLGALLRTAVDFDNDGYSPIAWGGDCDDFDATRNPSARDHDGIDANCNGTVRPAHPSDEERGLAPPFGDPNAQNLDLVVLISIDCMRADSLQPQLTPRLFQLAQSGIRFERLYGAGTRTLQSLPLLFHESDAAEPLAAELGRKSIATIAIFSSAEDALESVTLSGFAVTHTPTKEEVRFSASQVTDQAIAALGSGRTFLWLHYYDAHYPQQTTQPLPAPPGRPPEMGRYLGALADIDREIGRLVDHLAPRWQKTLMIVTADHGESFGEHEIPYHRLGAYEAVAHVPGFVAGGTISARTFSQVASHRDVPPTILGAFGIAREEFGRSWLRLAAAPDKPLHRFVVVRSAAATSKSESHPMAALVEDRLKLVNTFENDLVELYDPLADPDEKNDLRPKLHEETARMLHELAIYRDIDGYP